MSWPKDLDEYKESELLDELKARATLRVVGRCDYCRRLRTERPCRFKKRHAGEKE